MPVQGHRDLQGDDTVGMSVHRSRILLVLFIVTSQFSSALMHSIVGVTLPVMGAELGASGVALALVDTAFLGTSAALLLPIGRLADATDKNTLFKAALLALAATTFALGLQTSMPGVIAVRALQGAAAALLIATGMAIVADVSPRNRLGQMFGLAIGATYIGLASGPYFSGLVTTHFGWRWVYFLAAVPPVLSYFICRLTLESRWRAPKVKINLLDSALLIAAVLALISGAALLSRTAFGYALIGAGLVISAIFLLAERRSANPLLELGKVRANRALSRALSIQFLIYCGTVGTTFMLIMYLQIIKGYTPEAAGRLLILGPIVMAVFAPIAGRTADRIPPGTVTAFGAALILCSVSSAALIRIDTGIALIAAVLVFQGIGFAFFSAPNITTIMTAVAPEERGLASALTAVMRALGMVVSMFTVTTSLSIELGSAAIAEHPEGFLAVMPRAFGVFSLLTAVGVVVAIGRRRARRG